MHPHIELVIANDRIADRVAFAERERMARRARLRPSRRRLRFAFGTIRAGRPATRTRRVTRGVLG
jgi:hypothetical protein